MKIFFTALGLACLLAAPHMVRGATVVSWASTVGSLDPLVENASFGTIGEPGGVGSGVNTSGSQTFLITGFTVPSPGSFAGALAAGDYMTFGFTTTTPVDLTDMDIRYDRTGASAFSLQMQLSVNGGPFVPFFTDDNVSASGEDNLGIDLSAFDAVTDADFRIVLYQKSGTSSGSFDLENIGGGAFDPGNPMPALVIRGELVPEPATVALVLSGLAAVCLRRRFHGAC